MRSIARSLTLALGVVMSATGWLAADVRLPAVFSDFMVIQRDMPVPVWGWAEPAERVTVSLADQSVATSADAQGRWSVRLTPMSAGGPLVMRVRGRNTLEIKEILVGEVWLASGQSNMEMNVASSLNPRQETSVDYPAIRMFTVERAISDTPRTDLKGQWTAATAGRAGRFSAVGYYFARHIHVSLDVPVGIIHSSWGGTAAEGWTPPAAFDANPALKPIVDRYAAALAAYPAELEKFKFKMGSWELMVKEAKAEGREPPRQPQPPRDPSTDPSHPSALYNAMIAPLVPYAIRGAIWYQGESNAGRPDEYAALFGAMIAHWRKEWGQGDFPFLFVQLANYMARRDEPTDSGWARLREAQLRTLRTPNTGMAVAIDIGDAQDIHPKNKQDVGRRLALWALARVYGRQVVYCGPLYETMAVEGSSIRLRFSHVAGGLRAANTPVTVGGPDQAGDSSQAALRGPEVVEAGKLEGFAIAGEDGRFVWAEARIEGETIVVSSSQVSRPVAVRYAWADNPACNLYNSAGLPASPFRTDDWPAGGGR